MDKQELRRAMRRLNQSLTPAVRAAVSARICEELERSASFEQADCIACFCARDDEPTTEVWLHRWREAGHRVVVPRVEGDRMQFYDWSPTTQCVGAFGIDEPTSAARLCTPSEIDLMVVPGVAFTRDGKRLGRGKGYYDRYLSQPDFHAPTIGVGYRHQLFEELPTEAHDVSLDAVICARGAQLSEVPSLCFRKAEMDDFAAIWSIVEGAVRRLGAAGVDQWQHGYPNRATIAQDLADEIGYVLTWEERVVAYGTVLFTGEPAYAAIDGEWLTPLDTDYVVVHRLCVAEAALGQGLGRHFMEQVEQLAAGHVTSFRVDTHGDNPIMHNLLQQMGFRCCGIVYFESRYLVAYEKVLSGR